MESLIKYYKGLLSLTTLDFKRYLYSEIAWSDRMIGIVGPRGVGKTTMILQYIKENLDMNETLYVQADDIYFANHTLLELADEFSKNGGKYLFIDEIHKYAGWSQSLKSIYDYFPQMKVVFTGSSILDILKGSADLSRRALMFKMQGLSFREYLFLFHHISVETYSLSDILEHKTDSFSVRHPLPLFKDYLQRGYYPFGTEDALFLYRLNQIIIQTLETDIPFYANLIFALAEEQQDVGNIRKTVFFNQMCVKNKVYRSEKADFNINNLTFEVGGKSKKQEQIKELKNAYIVKDDIEYGYQNTIPLWAFGLNY